MVYEMPRLIQLVPNTVQITRKQTITCIGLDFFHSNSLTCKIGDTIGTSNWISSSLFTCVAPANKPGNVSFEVSNNGQDYTSSGLRFQVLARREWQLSPTRGPTAGGIEVTVIGFSLTDQSSITIRLAGTTVRVLSRGGNNLTFTLPEASDLNPGKVEVYMVDSRVRVDQGDFRVFEYVEGPRILSLQPSSGTVEGHTRVTVIGSYDLRGQAYCRFHMQSLSGQDETVTSSAVERLTSSTIVCATPPSVSPGSFFLQVSDDHGSSYSSNRAAFLFHPRVELQGVRPSRGYTSGSSLVTCIGSGFLDSADLQCRFGSVKQSRLGWLSSSLFTCVAPANKPGNVSFEVSNNGQDYTSSGLRFQVLARREWQLSPTRGPTAGGIEVTVIGFSRTDQSSITIRLAGTTVRVLSRGGNNLTFTLPEASDLNPGKVEVYMVDSRVRVDQGDFRVFEYVEGPRILSLQPSSGTVEGHTRVTVVGSYDLRGQAYCRFHMQSLSGQDETVTSSAVERLTSSTIVCATPPSVSPGSFFLQVSDDHGSSYSSNRAAFLFHPRVELQGVRPSRGYTSGSSLVTCIGSGFLDSADLQCRFGSVKQSRLGWLSSSLFTCVAPANKPGNVSFEVSNNGQDYTSSGLRFQVLARREWQLSPTRGPTAGGTILTVVGVEGQVAFRLDVGTVFAFYPASDLKFQYVMPSLSSISPSVGFINGGTVVTVNPQHFTSLNLECMFANIKVIGSNIGSGLWTCMAPPFTEGIVMFEVTGMQSDLRFVYVQQPIVITLQPSIGFVNSTSNNFLIIGKGFDRNHFDVYADSYKINQSVWVSSSIIQAFAPLYPFPKTVTIQVLNGPLISSYSQVKYMLLEPIKVSEIVPSSILEGTDGCITVNGQNFDTELLYQLILRNLNSFEAIKIQKDYLIFRVNESFRGNVTAFIQYGGMHSEEFTISFLPSMVVDTEFFEYVGILL
ncbi:hypothetical protein GUITHDRAFT_112038 [Guillardia theta CCMP2712]|uniref:IPT/TIG domain-containing protein n=1 Tax=Guillardia theta (strain CCMP2712) TaxID=905079 RepID=L1J052_GUITC|nr:hypothetical protein GUITHDRAFT_112038 [Guillardia theta CCMP2712]EKX41898.1 hypothetical protein GUITHDRAFT_112038 [Guillardia theta CCMP2712]|eukprot:XP_005828878.1 hypothetical protein GUITHDRAFT_112038 [Guillardia theta CCMP2712]